MTTNDDVFIVIIRVGTTVVAHRVRDTKREWMGYPIDPRVGVHERGWKPLCDRWETPTRSFVVDENREH